MKKTGMVVACLITLSSCVSLKKLGQQQAEYDKLNFFYAKSEDNQIECRNEEVGTARGESMSVYTNNTASSKAANRRTRMVILPQLDQFFQLLK